MLTVCSVETFVIFGLPKICTTEQLDIIWGSAIFVMMVFLLREASPSAQSSWPS